MDGARLRYLRLTARDQPATALQPGRKWMLEDDFVSASRATRSDQLTVGDWLRSLRDVRELNWLVADGPHPALRWLGQRLRARVA